MEPKIENETSINSNTVHKTNATNDPKSKIKKKELVSPQELIFAKQINFLNQTSYLSLIEMENPELSRQNQHNIKELTNKKPIKLSPDLKYFYCKKCEIMLIPGKTSRVRIKSKREPHVVSTCLNCETLKRYNIVNNNKKSKLEDKKKIKAKKTVKEESLIEKKV